MTALRKKSMWLGRGRAGRLSCWCADLRAGTAAAPGPGTHGTRSSFSPAHPQPWAAQGKAPQPQTRGAVPVPPRSRRPSPLRGEETQGCRCWDVAESPQLRGHPPPVWTPPKKIKAFSHVVFAPSIWRGRPAGVAVGTMCRCRLPPAHCGYQEGQPDSCLQKH